MYVADTLICMIQAPDKGTVVPLRVGGALIVLCLELNAVWCLTVAAIGRVVFHISNIPSAIHNNCISENIS